MIDHDMQLILIFMVADQSSTDTKTNNKGLNSFNQHNRVTFLISWSISSVWEENVLYLPDA